MKCPICRSAALTKVQLDQNLPAHTCSSCHGHWIAGETYLHWVETRNPQPETPANAPVAVTSNTDSRPAKLCPHCGRFLIGRRISLDLPFHIDRCGGCAGFWLDASEWDTLKTRNLHDDLHRVVSTIWQQSLAREQRRQQQASFLTSKIGPDDFAELQRIRKWLTTHPHQSELWAYLAADDET